MGDKGIYRSLDKDEFLQAAKYDPNEFVKNSGGTMVIDEIQKVPSLLSEIKLAVDKNNRPGQYLLTGSTSLQTAASVNDSLAGRIKHIRLRPLTVGEILKNKPAFLERAFRGDFPVQIKGYDKDAIFDFAFRGGYPEAVRIRGAKERKEWHRDYINNLINKELYDIGTNEVIPQIVHKAINNSHKSLLTKPCPYWKKSFELHLCQPYIAS
jgi:predicted AAA+ superfamily ATPase